MALKEDFKGTGSMDTLAEQVNKMARAMNNITIKMPLDYTGRPATARIEDTGLVIDFTDATFN